MIRCPDCSKLKQNTSFGERVDLAWEEVLICDFDLKVKSGTYQMIMVIDLNQPSVKQLINPLFLYETLVYSEIPFCLTRNLYILRSIFALRDTSILESVFA